MNRGRTHRLAVALVLTGAASLLLCLSTLAGFSGGGSGGDMIVASGPATNLLLVLGVAVLLGLELTHARGRKTTGSRRRNPAARAIGA